MLDQKNFNAWIEGKEAIKYFSWSGSNHSIYFSPDHADYYSFVADNSEIKGDGVAQEDAEVYVEFTWYYCQK